LRRSKSCKADQTSHSTIISSQPRFPQSQAAANLLSLLEKLKTLPSEAKELDEWWVPELGKRPASAKGKGKATADEVDDGEDAEAAKDVDAGDEDDWRKFFDDDDSTKVGAKAKGPANLRKPVTLHASLHSLPAHRAVFTKCWLSLLPCITSTALTSRALAIFHRLVLPHLTRPVLVVDWVGEAVDKGGATGLLALNTLFILMTSHNLYVIISRSLHNVTD
jgi:U3 small nucleolar RNA-associated protein 19